MNTPAQLDTGRTKKHNKNGTKSRFYDLIETTLDLWGESREATLSVRNLTSAANATGSSIDYHFGGIEHVYVKASRHALTLAQLWMEDVLIDLAAYRAQQTLVASKAQIISSVIDQWASRQRKLAMAWRRTKALPKSPEGSCLRREWDHAWIGFWADVSATLGLGAHASAITAFADGEACRHLLGWKPVLDASLLNETVFSLLAWLSQNEIANAPCRMAYRERVFECFGDFVGGPGRPVNELEDVAASLLANNGRAGVTFRAVAKQANSTLGAVAHHFGSKNDLMQAALYRLYEREAIPVARDELEQHQISPATIFEQTVGIIAGASHPVLRAYDEIELAIYNDPDFAGLRATVRCMDDPGGTWALKQMFGGLKPSQSLVAAYSSVCRGAGHLANTSALPQDDREAIVRATLEPFCTG